MTYAFQWPDRGEARARPVSVSGLMRAAPAPDAGVRNFAAVVNLDAGGLAGRNRRRLVTLLRSHGGIAPERTHYADGGNLKAVLRDLAAARPDAVIVCGGDGTARTAIETLTPLGIPAAPLPGGTLNRLVHAIYGEAHPRRVLDRILRGRKDWVQAGVVAGRRFYVVSGYGAPLRLNAVREALRGGDGGEAWQAWRQVSKAMFNQPITLGPDGRSATCAIVALGPVDSAFGLRAPRHRDSFEIAAVHLRGWGSAAALAPFALMGGWRDRPEISTSSMRTLALKGQGYGIPALLDGEPFVLPDDAVIAYEERAGLVWR